MDVLVDNNTPINYSSLGVDYPIQSLSGSDCINCPELSSGETTSSSDSV